MQNLMAPNLSAIARDFGFNDEERDEKLGGNIAFGFFILGAPAALIVGYLADTVHRCRLLGLVVVFGESACFATYWVKTYEELFICRVLTGISIGGATPIIFSLLADYYPEELRVYVSTIVGVSLSFGIAAGQMLSGVVGPTLGWRAPFLIVAVPAILLGLLIGFTGKEPKRGSQERSVRIVSRVVIHSQDITTSCHYYQSNPILVNHSQSTPDNSLNGNMSAQQILGTPGYEHVEHIGSSHSSVRLTVDEQSALTPSRSAPSVGYSEKIDCKKVGKIFQTPSAILVFMQGIPGCVPWGVIYVFLNDYFSSNRGLSVEQSTMAIFTFGMGGLIGQLFGGWLGQVLYIQDKRLQCVLMSLSTLLSVLPMMYLINADVSASSGFYAMAAFAGALVSINGPNVRTVLQVSQLMH
jgi:MFS family permease